MKVLVFDLKESENRFFKNNTFNNFEFELFKASLSYKTKLSEEQLNETDAISVSDSSILTEDILSKFKNLRVIASRSSECSHIDTSYCTKSRIAVMNVGQYGEDAIAQCILCLIIMLVRKMKLAFSDMLNNSLRPYNYEGKLLNGLKIGIIGCGNVGMKLAETVKIFGMKVLVSSYKKTPLSDNLYEIVSFEELLSDSDIIILHMPYGDNIGQILGEKEFEKMKNGVTLISTSEIELISLDSLYRCVIKGKIQGVGLDIFYKDIKNHKNIINKLLKLENVIITPKLANNTENYTEHVLNSTLNNIRNYYKGMNSNRIC